MRHNFVEGLSASNFAVIDAVDQRQGCQISLAARCQNGENLTK
jgi:hypothetical protein